MKTIFSLLGLGFVIVMACMIYLLRSGVSIRTAPIIKPSPVGEDFSNVGQGSFLRLFPDLQKSHYIVWGVSQNSGEVQMTLAIMRERTLAELKTPVNMIYEGLKATRADLEKCARPCWILMPEEGAHELARNNWIEDNLKPLNEEYATITWINFDRHVEVPKACIEEKRLDIECLKLVSVNEVARKMKEDNGRNFFMRKYMDRDYFLFVENTK